MYTSIYMQAATKAGKAIQKKTKHKAIVDKPSQKVKAIVDKKKLDPKVLEYRPAVTKPRRYGSVTIYTSVPTKAWRVKPAPGRRDETFFKYSVSPRDHWKKLVKLVQSLEQV